MVGNNRAEDERETYTKRQGGMKKHSGRGLIWNKDKVIVDPEENGQCEEDELPWAEKRET